MLDTAYFEREAHRLAREILIEAAAPPPSLDLTKWVPQHVRVPDGPREGQLWDLSLTPFWREILECLSPNHPATRVTVRKSAQLGFTMVLIAWMLAIVAVVKRRAMIVMPSLGVARDFVSEKLQPAIDKCAAAAALIVPQKPRAGDGSTALNKKFPGGSLRLTGANSTADLRSKTIPLIGCDEIDEYDKDLGGQGDPMGMIDARQLAFHASGNFKKLEGGTPTVKGYSRIDESFEESDQRYYEVPCPHCGEAQDLVWEQLHWQEEWPHQAEYACRHCGGMIGHHEKQRMLRAGKWVARAPGAGRHPGFHINALYSPFTTWDAMVAAYLKAKDDPLELKAWSNLWKGESFEVKGEAPTWQELKQRAQAIDLYRRGEIPDEALVITASVDVQGSWLEVGLWGWGVGKTSYALDRFVIQGDPNDLKVWGELEAYRQREFRTKGCFPRVIEMMAIDSGYLTPMVYNFVRGKDANVKGGRRVMAIKGASTRTEWVLGNRKKVDFTLHGQSKRGSVYRYMVGGHVAKIAIYGRLGLKGPNQAGQFPPGFCHFASDFDDDFYQQHTAELMIPVQRRGGRIDYEWRKPRGQRNEVLDLAVYAYAAAVAIGLDRTSPAQWARLAEERMAAAPEKGQLDMLAAVIAPPDGEQPKEEKKSLARKLAS